ncbi:glycosyltransferase family 20 protein [Pisolithus microcarpus 441]|uniref:Glycosyltransferase family 20 protein n=1 Tax=Pisolithus microcarpus 441 TaxID=765257 RepID=A0A0C9YBD6_9AGAM|nr:glycosyltransferase family 20 protein [Pisolithus microcarpus]KIK22015.1 glycosyltransferase family 20 protein [Pisolithus microcarpus 441]
MDTFTEPYTRAGDDISLDAVRKQVSALEDAHRAQGTPLSGRIVHVCHYLPVIPSLITRKPSGVLSPPPTPPVLPGEVPPSPSDESAVTATNAANGDPNSPDQKRWKLAPRYGHAAMFSGIRSLSASHDQLIVGWTGDIMSVPNGATPNSEENVSSSGDRVPSAQVTQADRNALETELVGYDDDGHSTVGTHKIDYVPVWLEDKVAHGHYDGYCKTTLWPLFHYLLWQDVATEYASVDANYEEYEQANQAFASRLASVLKPGDLVWVHDYHLLLVPRLLRVAMGERGTDLIIGLFVHTPFPSSEVFRCLPRRKEILEGMLGANLVCFQTYSYSRHFLSTCVRVCGHETASRTVVTPSIPTNTSATSNRNGPCSSSSCAKSITSPTTAPSTAGPVELERSTTKRSSGEKYVGVDAQGHFVAVGHCPVGVDAERVKRDTVRPGVQPKLDALRALYGDKKIIVGRDKLDVVKGVLQKLRAFEKLLHDYPEWRGEVVLIQVTSPALTDSPRLERQVSELVAHINGEYGSLHFIPVHHYHQTLKKDEFYALLEVADLGVITPLRDGMNTTSMEFVIAQERTKKSPLVLSEFMGISQHMSEALLVNPWDLGDVAAAMDRGLLMSEESKASRHAALHRVVTTHTSHTWAAVLVKMLLFQITGQSTARRTPYLPKDKLKESYDRAKKRLFLFDYDGTLTPIVKTPAMAVPSADALLALTKLTADPANIVYIVSGRDQAFLELHLGHIRHLGMSAEHGGFVREPQNGDREWINFTDKLDMGWMEEVAEIFKYYTERTTGSNIEVKKTAIVWHYRASDPEWGLFQCRQCQDLLENNVVPKRPIEVLVGKKNLEVRPIAVNKGEIVKRLLYTNPDAEFVFCAGDDKTDEDMFRALHDFPSSPSGKTTMEAPLSVTLTNNSSSSSSSGSSSTSTSAGSSVQTPTTPDVELAIRPDDIFTTSVGPSSKRTLAGWHVTTPEEVVDHMLYILGERGNDGAAATGSGGTLANVE